MATKEIDLNDLNDQWGDFSGGGGRARWTLDMVVKTINWLFKGGVSCAEFSKTIGRKEGCVRTLSGGIKKTLVTEYKMDNGKYNVLEYLSKRFSEEEVRAYFKK